MASIDHTCIIFKNGEWVEDTWDFADEFEYGRDGNIHTVNGKKIWDKIKWYRDEYDAIYERDGWRNFCSVRKTPYGFWAWLKYKLHFMHKIGYRKEVGVWCKSDTEVYIYHDELKQSYISFYVNETDTYLIIGGYGHWGNVYTHFMSRGYGNEFEKKMTTEAFRWACDDILVDISESICGGNWELEEDFVNQMRERFGYEEPYKIVDREEY